MKLKLKSASYQSSIEGTSILRKFTILFLLMSIIPLTVLYYFYHQIAEYGTIRITAEEFNLTMTFVVLGVLLSYFTMRRIIQQVMDLADANRKALEKVMNPERLRDISEEKNEIAVLAQSFQVITDRLEENVRELELAKKTLHSVMEKVGRGISSMQNIDSFLELIVETVSNALQCRKGVLMIYDPEQEKLCVKTAHGIKFNAELEEVAFDLVEDTVMHKVMNSRKAFALNNSALDFVKSNDQDHWFERPLICAPLVIQDKAKGMLVVSKRSVHEDFMKEDLNMLFNVASQTAIAIQNSKLSADMERTYFETITALALAVDAKDKYSRGHLARVADYCVKIANKLGLEEEDINTLRDAAMLHDIGKIGIPDEVLQKPGPLTDQEWVLMRKHPEIGESIIRPVQSLKHLCDIIRHHHEKLDGTGYPDGLKGDEITPLVRITTVADIYDALTTDRAYRERYPMEKAFAIMRDMKDVIDQDVVEAFIETFHEEKMKD